MNEFTITAPNGKKYIVRGETREGALAALRKMLGDAPQNASSEAPPREPEANIIGAFEAANPALKGVYAEDNLPEPGSVVIDPRGGGGGRSGAPRVEVNEWGAPKGEEFEDWFQYPADANPETDIPTGVDELGRTVYTTVLGHKYVRAKTVSVPAQKGLGDVEMGEILPALGRFAGGIVESIGSGLTAPGRALRGEPVTLGDVAATASLAVPDIVTKAPPPIGKGAAKAAGKAVDLAPNIGTKSWRNAFNVSARRPTVENLRAAKTAAYSAVDDAGEVFDAAAMTGLRDKVKADLDAGNYVTGVDRQTDAVVSILDRKAGQEMTLGQLDKLRQEFYKRLNAAPNEIGIQGAIDAIDELIASRTASSDLMQAARLSNARYKKAELLDNAFQKARDQTASTGSGGNILNKYRQAVTAIINDPRKAKWFSADEIAVMRQFIEGSTGENVLRRVGKLAPSGNGLISFLNVYAAVASSGATLPITVAAEAAKMVADGSATRGANRLMSKVAGVSDQVSAAPGAGSASPVMTGAAARSGAVGVNANQSPYDRLWERYGR